jgi:HK97 gp10 family phage protein
MFITRIRGIPQTKAALFKVQTQVKYATPFAVRAAGEVVRRDMASRAPRRTGRLASSIGVDVSTFGDGATARVGADVPYDRFVQKGTVYMEPQAYGEDAAESSEGSVVAAMIAVYRAAIT